MLVEKWGMTGIKLAGFASLKIETIKLLKEDFTMKKKWSWNNPITWKGYAKLCGISALISALMSGFALLWINRKYDEEKEDSEE